MNKREEGDGGFIHLSFTQDVGGINLGVGILCFEEAVLFQLLVRGCSLFGAKGRRQTSSWLDSKALTV